MPTDDPRPAPVRHRVTRRDFLKRAGVATVGMTPLVAAASRTRASAETSSPYPDWMPPSTRPPKRGKTLVRASAWDPPVLDPRLTNSVGLFQIASLTSSRLVRYPFSDEAANTTDLTLKKRIVGTGPFILKEHTRKVRVVLVRNPDYFDTGRPYVDEYHILSTPDAATRLAAFRSGQSDIHFVASLADAAAILKATPTAAVQEYKTVQTVFGLALAQDKPPFNDVRVRRAISMAIDRQKQVDTLYGGHGILGWGIPY